MTIKLTEAQLNTLVCVADPNYKKPGASFWEHSSEQHYFRPSLDVLARYGLVIEKGDYIYRKITLTPEGRAYLDSLGILPVELKPPPQTDKERIAELESAAKMAMNWLERFAQGAPFSFGGESEVYYHLKCAVDPEFAAQQKAALS